MSKMTLRAARVNVNLSQEEAATKLGVNKKTLSRWENGVSVPKGDKIDAICTLYCLPYDSIIFFNKKNA